MNFEWGKEEGRRERKGGSNKIKLGMMDAENITMQEVYRSWCG
jgi:hypothetical protein